MVGKPLALYGGALLALLFLGAVFFFAGREANYDTATVTRERIVREVSASGNVEPLSQIDLHFSGTGRLSARHVRAGDVVAAGDILAEQSVAELRAQLREMQAGVDVQRARLQQLLAGAAEEDVRVTETTVIGARETLEKALADAYTKADDAVRLKGDVVFIDPQAPNPELKFSVNDLYIEGKAETQRLVVENTLRAWAVERSRMNGSDPKVFVASTQDHLRDVILYLDYVSQALNTEIAGISETTLESWRSGVSTARANVNAAAAAIVAAVEDYENASASLGLKQAPVRSVDKDLLLAQIRQAEASMQRIQAQLDETTIVAPVAGTIVRSRGDVGEIVSPDLTIASLMPDGGLQVRLRISEGNIVNAAVGQTARITLEAFPVGTEWTGTVIEIEPAETVVGGAVYYEAVVAFDEADPRVRRGMTANVWIQTAESLQALTVPASAITMRDGIPYVRVLVNDTPEEREVQVGISSSEGTVEVISGVREGEEVILGERS